MTSEDKQFCLTSFTFSLPSFLPLVLARSALTSNYDCFYLISHFLLPVPSVSLSQKCTKICIA